MSYFCPAFGTEARTGNLRGAFSRKRKRGEQDEDVQDAQDGDRSASEGASTPSASPSRSIGQDSFSARSTELDPDTAFQYSVAGVEPGHQFREHFPHLQEQSNTLVPKPNSKSGLCEELARLNPPVLLSADNIADLAAEIQHVKNKGLRQQHIAVLTTVLHRCLLDGDYVRAGRAWGMLLRAEVNGHSFDVRVNRRWGIGAEVLLRRATPGVANQSPYEDVQIDSAMSESSDDPQPQRVTASLPFSKDSIHKARSYYERLVLQHPVVRNAGKNAVNALHFYPAMFGLWIYSIEERHRIASENTYQSDEPANNRRGTFVESSSEGQATPPPVDTQQYREDSRRATRREVEDIAAQLGELLLSPLYSDDATLWRLKGMVELWIGDLCIDYKTEIGRSNSKNNAEGTNLPSHGMQRVTRSNQTKMQEASQEAMKVRQHHLSQAVRAFENVQIHNIDMWKSVSNLLPDEIPQSSAVTTD
ncbi:hypothetical protein MMC09_000841 [Bachmanniomyces sp. S44760]|nr:hypothetical protein [Bachmanniomyces sp. S44760]